MPEWQLRAEPGSVGHARQLTAAALRDAPASTRDTVMLVVSELVTNGIRHVGTDVALRVTRHDDHVRVEVTDTGAGEPVVRNPGPLEPHGRGLRIVEALAYRWGVDPGVGGGKTVWCTIRAATV